MSDLVPTKGRGLSPRQEAAANRTLLEFQSPTIALVDAVISGKSRTA